MNIEGLWQPRSQGKGSRPWERGWRCEMGPAVYRLYPRKLDFRGAGMVQWREYSPPTNVARVRFQYSASDVG